MLAPIALFVSAGFHFHRVLRLYTFSLGPSVRPHTFSTVPLFPAVKQIIRGIPSGLFNRQPVSASDCGFASPVFSAGEGASILRCLSAGEQPSWTLYDRFRTGYGVYFLATPLICVAIMDFFQKFLYIGLLPSVLFSVASDSSHCTDVVNLMMSNTQD